ncbi:hypothetical protein BC834DRAFT_863779 [Gloeopeniophorella convolvens]|nr:hypothetical protein BC834DRAFT_863779 [Gloeopeniophorella convolvens]
MYEFGDPFVIVKTLVDVCAVGDRARDMLPSVLPTPFWIGNLALELEHCQAVDRLLHSAYQCIKNLCDGLEGGLPNNDEEQARLALRSHETEIRELDEIRAEYHRMEEDPVLFVTDSTRIVSDVCPLFPGASLNTSTDTSPLIRALPTSEFKDNHTIARQLFPAEPILRALVAFGPRLRGIIENTDTTSSERAVDLMNELHGTWRELCADGSPMNVNWERMEERRFWRMVDCGANAGFGFFVELFFIALQHLLPPGSDEQYTLPALHQAFHVLTFRALIPNDQGRHRRPDATGRVLLDLLCDTLIPGRGIVSGLPPNWAMSELLALLKDILQGEYGTYIDDAVRELEMAQATSDYVTNSCRRKALGLLRELGTSAGTAEVARSLSDA